jgi:polysaccharide biosynthesis/export protein
MRAVITALLGLGLLTSWVRHPAPLAIVQTGILATAVIWLLASTWRRRDWNWHPMLIPMAGAIAIALLQLLSGRTAYAWDTVREALHWTVYLTVAFLLLQALMQYRDRQLWLTRCALFGIVVSVVATLQLFTSPGKVFWVFESGYPDLVLGPFVYHNRYAQFVELLMPVALYRALTDRGRAPLWLLGAGVMFAGVIASVSRAGVVLLLVEILVVLMCAVKERFLERRTMWIVSGQVAGVALVGGTVAGWSGILERLFSSHPLEDWRVYYYQSSFSMIGDSPWIGIGLGTWPVVYPQHAAFDPGLFVNTAHSDWLQWTVEGGLPLLLLMMAFTAVLLRPALRSVWGVGLLVVLVHAMIDYPFQDAAFASAVFGFAGAVAAEHLAFIRSRPSAILLEDGSYMVKRVSVLPALCLMLIAPSAFAQNKPSTVFGPMGDAGTANLPRQKIGANDLLAISVYDAPEFTRTVRVSPDGEITLPMVSKKIRAAGLFPSDLESAVAERLVADGILVKPVVMVTVVEYYSRPISVMGAVRKPVTFQSVGRITVLDALARAEGLATEAGPEIVLTRFREGVREVTRIPVRELIDDANPEWNLALTGDEEIRVPEARKIYVVGNVKRPGAFPVKDGPTTTVLKALALAEGIGPFAQKMAYIYRAEGKSGARREIPVELAKLIDRKTPDVSLEPDDVLYILENRGKKNAITALEKASSFGLATASGVLIWRR